MTELLTAAQMKAIEAAAIASGAITGLELMERAGAGVVEAIFTEWPNLRAGTFRAVVLCGPGNNGGDGFVVARLLKEWGWAVEVYLYGTPEGMPPDARVNYERWVGMGEVQPLTEQAFRKVHPIHGQAYAALYVDAIFGAGLSRPLEGDARDVLTLMSGRNGDNYVPHTVAIDAPSGLCLDSGRALGSTSEWLSQGSQAMAALTVTFECPKPGHYLAFGPACCGKLVVSDIGIWPWRKMTAPVIRRGHWTGRLRVQKLHMVERGKKEFDHYEFGRGQINPGDLNKNAALGEHKFSHGHALILSGPPGHGGAARMTARGALRIGAGLVTLACPAEALAENAAHFNAVMLKTVVDGAWLAAILKDTRINALCLGPGLGLDARAAELVQVALEASRGTPRPTGVALEEGAGTPGPNVGRGAPRLSLVLDADALTLIARDQTLLAALHPNCVLTPHAGEFARLFPDIAAKLEAPATKGPAYSKVDATREAAARANCTVLYKGPDTVIASPDGTCAINSAAYDRAAPWLATAGSGDVLAGFITGLLARGFAPQRAAETGAWLHVECARSFGPGLIAEDLAEELPKVFRALGL